MSTWARRGRMEVANYMPMSSSVQLFFSVFNAIPNQLIFIYYCAEGGERDQDEDRGGG